MKAGRVVRIRVNPKDCMGCVDVVQKVGVVLRGMSYSQVVSIALSSLLNTVRDAKAIPDRDGFEYSQVMQPWSGEGDQERKLAITREIDTLGSEIVVPPVPLPTDEVTSPAIVRLESKIKEVYALQQADPANDRTQELLELDKQLKQQLAKERNDAS